MVTTGTIEWLDSYLPALEFVYREIAATGDVEAFERRLAAAIVTLERESVDAGHPMNGWDWKLDLEDIGRLARSRGVAAALDECAADISHARAWRRIWGKATPRPDVDACGEPADTGGRPERPCRL